MLNCSGPSIQTKPWTANRCASGGNEVLSHERGNGPVAPRPDLVRRIDRRRGGSFKRPAKRVRRRCCTGKRDCALHRGLDEGWALAHHVRATIAEGVEGTRRPIIAIVDVASQAYGRLEELLGIHLACAAAADAYASARLAGHPVIALLVGKAMSGAFLAHGYQANRIIALDSPEVMVHAMGKQAAARVTRSSVEEMEKLGERIAPMAYDIRSYAKLGLLHKLVEGIDADAPGRNDVDRVRAELVDAITDARAGASDLACRLTSPAARKMRAASIEVRRRLAEQWRSAEQSDVRS